MHAIENPPFPLLTASALKMRILFKKGGNHGACPTTSLLKGFNYRPPQQICPVIPQLLSHPLDAFFLHYPRTMTRLVGNVVVLHFFGIQKNLIYG